MERGCPAWIVLDDERYEQLVRMAERMGIEPGQLAAKLIALALDDSEADGASIVSAA